MRLHASALSVAVCLALALPTAMAKDGVYKATTQGRNGEVNVQVTIQNDKIADVKILECSETHPIADLPGERIPAAL